LVLVLSLALHWIIKQSEEEGAPLSTPGGT
jgi:hypothetical protein